MYTKNETGFLLENGLIFDPKYLKIQKKWLISSRLYLYYHIQSIVRPSKVQNPSNSISLVFPLCGPRVDPSEDPVGHFGLKTPNFGLNDQKIDITQKICVSRRLRIIT